ncbi:methylated-DNA--[protein]-cysteine S-methyltransferase [Citricoccus sp. SGAir0253]|uniref:methylated-DNA--[protein]-cysteine S-methyltransferase n=1 Tax=Citricoccus sp. SGAir0253 TaxID=2567881 RepID=UPI0010CD370B|nr:methylated-DNA--[protein]-cysteine S-methyltransferase [Citricoccus sp. SGAir0253]QCU78088.1 methylated-DNA--[protein]-cysteine S-methyltransferase [Citricoccus sp. SGAir0253]
MNTITDPGDLPTPAEAPGGLPGWPDEGTERVSLAALRRRLARGAEAEGLLGVAYREVDSPVGRLLLAATERGLVRVAFEREGFEAVLAALAQRITPRVLEAPDRLDAAARELEEYFAGRRRAFTLPLDLALSTGFRRSVQQRLPEIGYGRTMSYRRLAELLDRPTAVRAVGTACATNPLPLVVPCHRVVRSDGGLGGYLGGVEAKGLLLELEQHREAA